MKRLCLFAVCLFAAWGGLRAEVSIFLGDCLAQRGDTVDVGLYMSDAERVTAFQVDVTLPQGALLLGARLQSSDHDHSLQAKAWDDGVVRVGCWSPINATFPSGERRIASLTILFTYGMVSGSHAMECASASVVFPNGGKRVLTSTTATAWVNVAADDNAGKPQLLTERPTAQAFRIQQTDSRRWLMMNTSSGKMTIEDACDGLGTQFFLEPAFDAGEGCYYLRSAEGRYLNLSVAGTVVRMGVTAQPSPSAAVRLMLTDTRTYAIVHHESGQPLGTASTLAGTTASMKKGIAHDNWQLFPAEAAWPAEALMHVAQTASANIGLTRGEADYALRMAVHHAHRAAAERADTEQLSLLTERLKACVAEARVAEARGDDTVVTVPWGHPEEVPAMEYVASVVDEAGTRLFLSWHDGAPVLVPQIASCAVPLKDIFYNPYTDHYALRLRGDGAEGEGVYLTYDNVGDTLVEAARSKGEELRVWQVQTLTEALASCKERAGACGPTAQWRFDPSTRTLFISGSDRTAYYTSAEDTPWALYRHLIQRAVVAGEFKNLGSYLLAECTSLTRLTFTTAYPPVSGTNTFAGIAEGVEIRAVHPERFADWLPGSIVRPIALVQDDYTYCGRPQTPQVECDFETVVTATDMQTNVGTYSTRSTLRIYIEDGCYTLTQPFTYTIHPAPLVATTRACSRVYGSKNPKLTVTLDGLVGDDKEDTVVDEYPVARCDADKLSLVGDYVVTVSGGSLHTANYMLVHQPSVLTVRPARLTVRVQDATRMEGEPNPTFTCTYSGFVNGEDEGVMVVQPVVTCEADQHSLPGLYDIVATGGEAPNYELHHVTGILTVTPRTAVDDRVADSSLRQLTDMQGRAVRNHRGTVPSGLYIVSGKKVLIH